MAPSVSQHGIDGQIRKKAEPALIDADQRHIERRKLPCDIEHGTVAAQDDCEISALPISSIVDGRIAFLTHACGSKVIQQHFRFRLSRYLAKLDNGVTISGILVLADQCYLF